MKDQRIEKIKHIFYKEGPIVRTSILKANRFCSKDITELIMKGYLKKIKTGYYSWLHTANDLSDLEVAASVIPNAVICLYSAASYYELTTINPTSVDIAVPANGISPKLPEYPPVTIYKFAQNIFRIGITEIKSQNCVIRIYDKERIVCDFFRMRRQLGEDIAIEILKNYMSGSKNIQKLYDYAGKFHIKNIIKPYVEAMI